MRGRADAAILDTESDVDPGGQMFAEYFVSFTPAALVFGFLALITSPFLAMAAFVLLATGVLVGLGWAVLWMLRAIGRVVATGVSDRRALHERHVALEERASR